MIRYQDLPLALPLPVKEEFDRIYAMQQNQYGLVFAVRDLYETVLKVICLAVCFLMDVDGEDSFCKILLSPKQMAMGDWVNDLLGALKKSRYAARHPEVARYLKKVGKFYNSTEIVKWRNNFIGHGLMSDPGDAVFFQEVEDRINALIDFLKTRTIPSEILGVDFDHAAPFMYRDHGHYYIFESISSGGAVLYTDQTSRRRTHMEVPYFTEKRKKYFNQLNVAQDYQIRNQDIYLADADRSVTSYHLASYYKKPEYMFQWIRHCLDDNAGGIFLMQGGRGTGKSSFVLACDELNQHGDQKISLDTDDMEATVRAYYCSRIDFSNINDFPSYIGEVLSTLPDGNTIRSRSGQLPDARKGLSNMLGFYQKQYKKLCDKEKLVLFIDGIDELTQTGWKILDMLPKKEEIPEGVYLILTCRSEEPEVPPLILDFINHFSFTGQIVFDPQKENHDFMVSILNQATGRSQMENQQIAELFDNRLSVIPLLLNAPQETTARILEMAQTGSTFESDALSGLARAYLSALRLRYGEPYYTEFVRFLLTVSEGLEGLSLSELSILSMNQNVCAKTICFLKDASPFLTEFRSYRGNLYWISRPEYQSFFREMYSGQLDSLLGDWREELLSMDADGDHIITEDGLDALLYLCASLAELEAAAGAKAAPPPPDETVKLVRNMFFLCRETGHGGQIHRMRRALHGFRSVTATLELLLENGMEEDSIVELLLESAADAIERAVNLGQNGTALEIIQDVSALIEKMPAAFAAADEQRSIQLGRFYMNAMVQYCSVYDTENVERYFNKAMAALGAQSSYQEFREKYGHLKNALVHNYLGAFRNYMPEKIRKLAEELMERIKDDKPTFSKISDYLMVGMCYRSAGDGKLAEAIFSEACDMAEMILKERKSSFRGLLDPYEQQIYISVYWRLAQTLQRRFTEDANSVSFSELKLMVHTLDYLIDCLVRASQAGYGHLDFVRVDLMTTSALLRNMIAYKMSRLPFRIKRSAKLHTTEDYIRDAVRAASITEQAYATLDTAGITGDKMDAMTNLMNCACVYSSCGDNKRALALLEQVLEKYVPENEQEQRAYDAVRKKYQELKALTVS